MSNFEFLKKVLEKKLNFQPLHLEGTFGGELFKKTRFSLHHVVKIGKNLNLYDLYNAGIKIIQK